MHILYIMHAFMYNYLHMIIIILRGFLRIKFLQLRGRLQAMKRQLRHHRNRERQDNFPVCIGTFVHLVAIIPTTAELSIAPPSYSSLRPEVIAESHLIYIPYAQNIPSGSVLNTLLS